VKLLYSDKVQREHGQDMASIYFASHASLGREDLCRWIASGLLVGVLHLGAAALMFTARFDNDAAGDPYSVLIDLESVPGAPMLGRTEAYPGPQQVQTDQPSQPSIAQEQVPEAIKETEAATPPELVLQRASASEADLPEPKPLKQQVEEKPEEVKTERPKQESSEARLESAPTSAPQAAAQIVPDMVPTAGVAVDDSLALTSWRTKISTHVQRFKRYPEYALARQLHGTTIVKFTIDRLGKLISSEIITRSGVAVLDQESLTLLARAQPLPSAPTHLIGHEFTFTMPIRFNPPRQASAP